MNYKEYTVKVFDDGTKSWYVNDKRHREDGPAVEWADGGKWWYLNDKLHREDGPAVERADGTKSWYLNDKLHREDGPAVECTDGGKSWYLNDKRYSQEEFKQELNKRKSQTKSTCDGKVVEIEGKKYKLTEMK